MLYENPFTISPSRTGDAQLTKVELTGWSNQDMPRLWYTVTAGNDLELYSDSARSALVASGAIVSGEADIAEENDSNISGTILVEHTPGVEATGEITLSYCNEQDLMTWERDLEQYIPEGTFLGQPRFEQPIKRAKVKLDKMLANKLRPLWQRKTSTNEVDLSSILKPRQLAEAQALYALYLIYLAVNNGDEAIMRLAEKYRQLSEEELDITQLEIDYGQDNRIDTEGNPSGSTFTR